MKKAINTIRVTVTGLLIIFFTTAFVGKTSAEVKSDSSIQLKFVGVIQDQPLFELNLNNDGLEEYLVKVKDLNNETLYSGRIKGKNLSKKYRFNFEAGEYNSTLFNVKFEITSITTNRTVVFNVSKNVYQVEDVLVAKL